MLKRVVAAALPVALAAAPAAAQNGLALDPVPLVAEGLGLRMAIPGGAVTSSQLTDAGPIYFLTEGGAAPTWSMRISMLTPPGEELTAATLIGTHLEAVGATGRPFTILTNDARRVAGVEGHVLYVQQTQDDEQQLVSGWLILPTSERSFLVFSLLTTSQRFPALQPVLDACFASIELRSRDELREEHRAQIERGRAFTGTLTQEKLRSMLGPRQWFRIYKPSGTGRTADDTEVGFMSLLCLEGMRGQLTPERSPDSFGVLEAARGLMVIIEARAIMNAECNLYLDVEGRYWMAWDRAQEAWSVKQTQRQGDATRTAAETGIRNLATLEVIHSSKEELTREPRQWNIPDNAYLSQPELFLLGRLLPREPSAQGQRAFYYYESASRRLTQRVDTWKRTTDGSGRWILSTQSMIKPGTITQHFDADGNRIRRIDGDGTMTERIEPDELQRLWKSKGLVREP